jgi:hypothetical protein
MQEREQRTAATAKMTAPTDGAWLSPLSTITGPSTTIGRWIASRNLGALRTIQCG